MLMCVLKSLHATHINSAVVVLSTDCLRVKDTKLSRSQKAKSER